MSEMKGISFQDIAKALEECQKDLGCGDCPLKLFSIDCHDAVRVMGAAAIRELWKQLGEADGERNRLREENRWIPVTERRPDEEYVAALERGDEDVEVLAMIKGADEPTALRYDSDIEVFFAIEDGEFIAYTVTHWKPKPKSQEG